MTDAPDVLLVVLDSARPDRLSTYGHDRETTPALSWLADRATRYADAHTPAPWTLPSHCSLFTGLYPTEHGVTNGFADADVRLPADVPTLAERLADRGYRTAGFSNNPWVGGLTDLDRGFDEFVEWDLEIGREGAVAHTATERLLSRAHGLLGGAARTPVSLLKRRFFTKQLVGRARRWLDAADRPAFAFLNLMEAHSPYYPPRWAFRDLGLAPPGPIEARRLNLRLTAYVMGRAGIDGRRDRVLQFYDASLRFQDTQFAALVAAYRRAGRLEDALVVVCADHGKTLGEHDREGEPPHYLRPVNTHVPLVVKRPGQSTAERVDEPVELLRVFDLVQEGGRAPIEAAPDGALVEDAIPHTADRAAAVTRWRALVDGAGTFVRSEDGVEYLLGRDRGEVVASPDEPTLADYRRRLDDRVADLAAGEPVHASADEREMDGRVRSQLEDLGYLG